MTEIKYYGQCGFSLASEGVSVAIDLVLNDLFDDDGNPIRNYPPVCKPEDVKVDYVLCTHEHIDHMAIQTIKGIADSSPETVFVLPKGCAAFLTDEGIKSERVIGLSDGETISLKNGKLKITGLSVAHPVHMLDTDGNDRNLAYAIDIKGQTFVHLGDTYYTERLFEELRTVGNIDVLFTPINGMDEEKAKIGLIGNMSYQESADLAKALGVKMAVPTHFDMVIGNTEDPEKFVNALADSEIKTWVPDIYISKVKIW